jgi:hypothetical protein
VEAACIVARRRVSNEEFTRRVEVITRSVCDSLMKAARTGPDGSVLPVGNGAVLTGFGREFVGGNFDFVGGDDTFEQDFGVSFGGDFDDFDDGFSPFSGGPLLPGESQESFDFQLPPATPLHFA